MAVAPLPVEATLTTSPAAVSQAGFDGLSRSSGPDTNGEPPDPTLAVGPDHVMQILNSSFQTTDRAGNVLDGASLSGFVDTFEFADLGSPEWFDPHVIYDSLHGRWLMDDGRPDLRSDCGLQIVGTGFLFFATSDTSDPTGFWTGSYFFDDDFLIDFSAPGTSSDKFAFASNFFSMGDRGCLSRERLRRHGRPGHGLGGLAWQGQRLRGRERSPDGSDHFTPRVAVQVPATEPEAPDRDRVHPERDGPGRQVLHGHRIGCRQDHGHQRGRST